MIVDGRSPDAVSFLSWLWDIMFIQAGISLKAKDFCDIKEMWRFSREMSKEKYLKHYNSFF